MHTFRFGYVYVHILSVDSPNIMILETQIIWYLMSPKVPSGYNKKDYMIQELYTNNIFSSFNFNFTFFMVYVLTRKSKFYDFINNVDVMDTIPDETRLSC